MLTIMNDAQDLYVEIELQLCDNKTLGSRMIKVLIFIIQIVVYNVNVSAIASDDITCFHLQVNDAMYYLNA